MFRVMNKNTVKVLNMFRSKKYVTSYLNRNTTARSKSHENCHSKLYTTEDNNGFNGLYKRS